MNVDASFLNKIAVFSIFANFVLNSSVAFIIWWRVIRLRRALKLSFDDRSYRTHNTIFKLVGLLFTALALNYLTGALWRANDMGWEPATILRIGFNTLAFWVSLLAMYVMLAGRIRYAAPFVLGMFSITFSAFYVWLSV